MIDDCPPLAVTDHAEEYMSGAAAPAMVSRDRQRWLPASVSNTSHAEPMASAAVHTGPVAFIDDTSEEMGTPLAGHASAPANLAASEPSLHDACLPANAAGYAAASSSVIDGSSIEA